MQLLRKKSARPPAAAVPSASPAPDTPLGATALPGEAGVAFRVWAPNVDAVSVVGPFNDWKASAHRLVRTEDGVWSGVVSGIGAGEEYRYALRRGTEEFTRVDPRALKVTNSAGNGVVWAPPALSPPEAGVAPFVAATMDRLVIYELHIGTFHAVPGHGPGTFASAAEKLPYLRDLGVNAVEVMPVAEFAGDFSWGYNPAHPFAVESTYGGPEGFKAFADAAHAHGIAVILDVVYNHFGPGDLALWQFDGWSENGLGGIYFYNDWRASTPWGDSRPDYGRGEVRTYLRDNALMWLRHYGIDGLRWDATVYIRSYRGQTHEPADDLPEGWSLCQWLNDELRRERPGFITLAEDYRDNPWIVKSTGAGGAGFTAQWDGRFVHPVRAALSAADDGHRDLDAIISALRHRYDGGDAFTRVIFSESHDEVANGKARLPSEIDAGTTDSYPARKRSALGAVLTLTAPGVPMLFQGQEFLEDGWFRDEVPVDWAKLGEHGGIQALHRDLVRLRLDAGITGGLCGQHLETNHVNHGQKILGYRRWREGGAGDDVLVLINFSTNPVKNYDVGAPADGVWRVRLNTDSTLYSGDFADQGPVAAEARPEPLDGYAHRITVGIAAYSALILSQDRG